MIDVEKYVVTYICHTPCLVAKYSVMDAPVYFSERQQVLFLGEEEISKDKWFAVFKTPTTQILYCVPRESFHICFELEGVENIVVESSEVMSTDERTG